MKTKRNSNMELLRICAMLMIVAYHIYIHCITCQLTDLQSIQERGNGWFCTPNFSKRLCILALIAPWGQIGNAIFLIISGYFMSSESQMACDRYADTILADSFLLSEFMKNYDISQNGIDRYQDEIDHMEETEADEPEDIDYDEVL